MPRTRRGDVHDALEHLVSPGNGANLDSCGEAVKFVPSVAEDVYVRRGPLGALRYAAVGLLSITIAGAAISSRTADWRPLWLFLTLLVLGVAGDRVHARTGEMRLSAGLTVVALAMALLGPAPALA